MDPKRRRRTDPRLGTVRPGTLLDRSWRAVLALWSVLCTTAALAAIQASRPSKTFPDSSAYWDPTAGLTTMVHPIGLGRRPGLLTALIMRPAADPNAATTSQAVFACLCWGTLCAVIALSAESPRRAAYPIAAVVVLSTSPLVASWNTHVLSESVTLSAIALLAAGMVAARTWPCTGTDMMVAMALVTVAMARPQIGIVLAPMCLVVVLRRRAVRRELREASLRTLLAPTVIVMGTGFAALSVVNNAGVQLTAGLTFRGWYAFTQTVDYGTVGSLADLDSRRPVCAPLDKFIADTRASGQYQDGFPPVHVDALEACPKVVEWFNAGGVSPISAAISAPRSYGKMLVRDAGDFVSMRPLSPVEGAWEPLVQLAAPTEVGGWLVLAWVLAWRTLRSPALTIVVRRLAVAVVGVTALAAILTVSLDGIERSRHAVPFAVAAALAAHLWPRFDRSVRSADEAAPSPERLDLPARPCIERSQPPLQGPQRVER